jgi:Spy/CpxP family protein refolding chaperone
MSPSLARPWVIMALIFVLGGITGSLLTIGFGSRFEPGPQPPPGPQELGNHWMMHLAHRLNLTDDQQGKIRPIVTNAVTQIETVHHQDVAAISKIMEDTNAKIAQVLTPDQQAALKQMESERERMFLHHMHGHGPDDDFHHHGPGDHPPGPRPDSQPATPVPSS